VAAAEAIDTCWRQMETTRRWNMSVGTGTDGRVLTDGNRPDERGVGSDSDVVFQCWMAFLSTHRFSAERHTVIDEHVVADIGRLTDDSAHSVVDEQSVTDVRTGV